VRIDSGVGEGDFVGIHYDPMIAKIIVHGEDRNSALVRLGLTLREYQLMGLHTNLGFLGRLAASPELLAARLETGFIERHRLSLFKDSPSRLKRAVILAAATRLPALRKTARHQEPCRPWELDDNWRLNLKYTQRLHLWRRSIEHIVTIHDEGEDWRFSYDGVDFRLSAAWIDAQRLRVELDAQRIEYPVRDDGDSVSLLLDGEEFCFQLAESIPGDEADSVYPGQPVAPMPGNVVALPVATGDFVEVGDTLVVIEAMKMEHAIVAQRKAMVGEIYCRVGDQVNEADLLMDIAVVEQTR